MQNNKLSKHIAIPLMAAMAVAGVDTVLYSRGTRSSKRQQPLRQH